MGDESGEERVSIEHKLLLEALTKRMEKLMDAKLETFREEYQPQATDRRQNQRRRNNNGQQEHAGSEETDNYYEHISSSSRQSQRRQRRGQEGRLNQRDELAGLKIKIPSFHGKADPDAYLEWEKKIELVFQCKQYTNQRKIQIAATEFYDYALSWWDQYVTNRRRNGEEPVETWTEMKSIMRKRFVPSHYHRDLHHRLRKLTQGSKSVEEYYQEMELLMLRASISEDREATMSRFLCGLNREIQDNVETHHYVELEEMLHKAILVEQQIKRKGYSRSGHGTARFHGPKEEKNSSSKETKPYQKEEAKTSTDHKGKDKAESSKTRSRDVKCFKCQGRGHYANECTNKRAMVLLENGDYESEDLDAEHETSSEDEQEEEPERGKLLVARRALNLQSKREEHEQRENLFHTRCLVQGKVCSLIIDGGSCTNVASEIMVQKLGLKTKKHPQPYKLQWLNENGEMNVTSQVTVPIAIGKYKDEILCDVLPMGAGHILLGRPWQSDRKVMHNGFTNKYSFEFNGRKTVLVPLTPKEVYQDQLELKQQGESTTKKSNFFAKSGDVKKSLNSNKTVLLFVYKEALSSLTNLEPVLPSEMSSLLQDYKDVFPEESPKGLPPIRGIEHQIDFIPGASLPNRPA